ncbi:dihydrodipicolinate reductase [Rhizocola hellebori]|uniref:Dihydrodipicolinate reductase n=1 Tax=Rhizocola hellebori TaxID=1392758 RepID=A0A8J3Q7W2_9ACTN|nr:dihydrodipicolinate reductase [Rhizocola hellebori]GIH04852.1 dihydrodipicolinate reductase [Rhizocola hellebori]
MLKLVAILVHDAEKVGRDGGDLGDLGHPLGIAATDDIDAVLAAGPQAVVYAASGEIRPDEALDDIVRAIRAGAVVVTPSIYALYDQRNAPDYLREPVLAAIGEAGGSLFVSGVDPGWGNDVLPLLISGLGSTVDVIRCQEIFDYSTYDQENSVRYLVGMGQPMEYEPPMLAPTVPTMVWGGQIRLMARALGVELDDVVETVDRRPLETSVSTTSMGEFEAGTQGALRFEVLGIVDGRPRIVIEHVTRIHASCAPDWPTPPTGDGAHRVIIEGRPRIEVTVEATDEGGNRSAGGNATAAARLVNAIDWLVEAAPGFYDALDVPLRPAVGKLGRTQP